MKVLLADESRAIRNIYRAALRETRYATAEFAEAENGLEALRWIRSVARQDDLVIADWDLPEINGLSLMEQVRELKSVRGLSVLLCVNHAQSALAQQAVRLGARGFIVRPFSDKDLGEKIEALGTGSGSSRSGEGSDVIQDIVSTVRAQESLPFLMSLPSSVIAELFRRSSRSTHQPGAVLVRVGDRIESLSFVTAGEVEVSSSRDAEGVELRGPGECFAERAFICGEPSKTAARAKTLVELVTVPKEDMVDLARGHAAIRNFLNQLLTRRPCGMLGGAAAAPETELCGTLRSLPFPDLLQFLCTSRKSGVLSLEETGKRGRIYLEGGEVTDVRMDGEVGETAFFKLAGWHDAGFAFAAGGSTGTRTVRQSTMKLLMDAFLMTESPSAVPCALAG
jgi:two-component system chemotaxis response regulator CheY